MADLSNYSKIVVFGSSDTYGHGLPDCKDMPALIPSKHAWPSLISQMSGITVENLSKLGASNREILLKILNTDLTNDALVIVCWTHVHRSFLLGSDNSIERLIPIAKNTKTDCFYRLYDLKNLAFNSLIEISHANAILKNKGCRVYNFYTDNLLNPNDKYFPLEVNLVEIDKRTHIIDFAEDKLHPGLKSHASIANYIYGILNE